MSGSGDIWAINAIQGPYFRYSRQFAMTQMSLCGANYISWEKGVEYNHSLRTLGQKIRIKFVLVNFNLIFNLCRLPLCPSLSGIFHSWCTMLKMLCFLLLNSLVCVMHSYYFAGVRHYSGIMNICQFIKIKICLKSVCASGIIFQPVDIVWMCFAGDGWLQKTDHRKTLQSSVWCSSYFMLCSWKDR